MFVLWCHFYKFSASVGVDICLERHSRRTDINKDTIERITIRLNVIKILL